VTTEDKGWSPYIAGVLSGLVIIASAWIANNFFGASTCFVRTAGFIERLFDPDRVLTMDYFVRYIPKVDWQVMMVIGILIGAFISAITSGSFKIQAVPDMWAKHFGPSKLKRNLTAFAGGVILMFGARLAGGCPSGYGLGALVQLAVSGLIVIMCFFIGGIVVAQIMYHGGDAK
jgi:uncharacterized membrane protein YedE/YeeE